VPLLLALLADRLTSEWPVTRIRFRFTVSHVIVGEMRHQAESAQGRRMAGTYDRDTSVGEGGLRAGW
jgi:hypothetical protein